MSPPSVMEPQNEVPRFNGAALSVRDLGSPEQPIAAGSGRWWFGVVVGMLVAFPAGLLLSFAALLPFMLGLFFFVLIGLIIGAATYRIAKKGGLPGRGALLFGTTLIVAVGWGTSILKEASDFPHDVAVRASNSTRDLGGRTTEQFRAKVAEDVRHFLRDRYPPGGLVGYSRWVMTRGELRETDVTSLPRRHVRDQRGAWWAIRVVLSIGFFAFGVGSQTFSLVQPAGSGKSPTRI